jgi:hypothetical protein
MQKLSSLIRNVQSMRSTGSDQHMHHVRRALDPLTENTGISEVGIVRATAHEVIMTCNAGRNKRTVRLLPTFHGVEVKIDGQDDGSKASISKVFKEAFQ